MNNIQLDEFYKKAKTIVLQSRKPSTSYLQRKLQISWTRADEIMQQLEKMNIVSSINKKAQRKILVKFKERKTKKK